MIRKDRLQQAQGLMQKKGIDAYRVLTVLVRILMIAVVVLSPMTAGAYDNKMAVPLRPGVFLVATPALEDSNFIHTVILLVSYGKDGTVGLVINRPSGISLQRVLPDLKGIEKRSLPLYLGGPVSRNSLYVLFTSDHPPPGAQKVFDRIYFADRKDVITPLLQEQDLSNKVRVYAGLAGWFHGQLEQEVRRGAWVTMEADSKMVFTDNPLSVWPSIFKIREDLLVRTK